MHLLSVMLFVEDNEQGLAQNHAENRNNSEVFWFNLGHSTFSYKNTIGGGNFHIWMEQRVLAANMTGIRAWKIL